MKDRFLSPEPAVQLIKHFPASYENFLAAARTCYSSKGIISEESIDSSWDWLAESLYQAGHHTTLQHASFQFSLDSVSRHFVWSFLHSHPFYNSEQVSQRYVTVKPGMAVIPPFEGKSLELYESTIAYQMDQYRYFCERLYPLVEAEYKKRFPARKTSEKKYQSDIKKKSQEIARYVLPVGTFTYLYHTISAITLLRYYCYSQQYDTPLEQSIVIQKMADALLAVEPKFVSILHEPIPLEETPEFLHFESFSSMRKENTQAFISEFDASLNNQYSKLVSYKNNNEEVLADSVREVLGLPKSALDDQTAIEMVLNPGKNRLLGDSLNLTTHSKLARCMVHPSYTFRKKISHTADSQDQRHRMTPASRPILAGHLTNDPDYITPELIRQDETIHKDYDETMNRVWDAMNELRCRNEKDEYIQYLLPNAVSIRFSESGDLLNLRHKYTMRLCYNAQEEIWRSSLDEVRQITEINPTIGKFLLPPCTSRKLAERKPICPEGSRFCGERVWMMALDDYDRVI